MVSIEGLVGHLQLDHDAFPIGVDHPDGDDVVRGLRVLLGTFERSFSATTETFNRQELGRYQTRRSITIWNCRIITGGEIDGQQYEEATVYAYEVYDKKPGPLGVLAIREKAPWISLTLWPDVFAQIWAAAEATDGATRSLSVVHEVGGGTRYIWEIVLNEVMRQDN